MKLISQTVVLFLVVLTIAWVFTSSNKPSVAQAHEQVIKCTEPRRQVCTKEYSPVCATKVSDLECITPQCSSVEKVTYSTGCTACSDSQVLHYTAGKCEP